jgi:hypothetical protein
MANHVFISYSTRNEDYARRLARSIEAEGIPVWIAIRMKFGADFLDLIQEKIEGCFAVVIVASTHARKSKWVKAELRLAQDLGKEIIPLLLDSPVPWFPLGALNCVDVTNGELPAASFYEGLKESLRSRQDGECDTNAELVERHRASSNIVTTGRTPFACGNCGFPVKYDRITGVAMSLLLGLPLIGGTVLQYLAGWTAAILFAVLAFGVIYVLISAKEEWCWEPSRCPKCGMSLRKSLGKYF